MKNAKRFTILSVLDTTISDCWRFLKNWRVWLSYATVLALLGILSGNWSHTCKDSLSISWWCASASSAFGAYARMGVYFLCSIVLCFAFCYDIYQQKAGFSAILKFGREKLKFMGFAFGLCALFFSSLAICIWLIFRKANPNWLVEFGFFLVVFAFGTLAVLILRTSASLGVFLQSGKMPDFVKLFKLTSGKFYVVLITFCLLTYAVNLLLMHLMGMLELWNIKKTYFAVALVSEFLSSLLKFFVLGGYAAYFLALKECLLPEEVEETEQPANDVVPAVKKVRKKASATAEKSKKTRVKTGKKRKI